jgi:group I intron endonuclease
MSKTKCHYVYKTTNLVNHKIYVGKRSYAGLIEEDSYLGSGTLLKRALNKYGSGNFTKEILFILDSAEEAFSKEEEIVTPEFIAREDTYNLCIGGGAVTGMKHSEESKSKIRDKLKNREFSEEHRKKISDSKKGTVFSDEWKHNISEAGKGKHPSKETRKKMSESRKGKSKNLTEEQKKLWSENKKGSNNPMYGIKGKDHPSYGKVMTEEDKEIMRQKMKNKPDLTCPHCGKVGNYFGMKRWHFNNCKLK